MVNPVTGVVSQQHPSAASLDQGDPSGIGGSSRSSDFRDQGPMTPDQRASLCYFPTVRGRVRRLIAGCYARPKNRHCRNEPGLRAVTRSHAPRGNAVRDAPCPHSCETRRRRASKTAFPRRTVGTSIRTGPGFVATVSFNQTRKHGGQPPCRKRSSSEFG